MRGKRMAKRVAAGVFFDGGFPQADFDRPASGLYAGVRGPNFYWLSPSALGRDMPFTEALTPVLSWLGIESEWLAMLCAWRATQNGWQAAHFTVFNRENAGRARFRMVQAGFLAGAAGRPARPVG